eukprot:403367037
MGKQTSSHTRTLSGSGQVIHSRNTSENAIREVRVNDSKTGQYKFSNSNETDVIISDNTIAQKTVQVKQGNAIYSPYSFYAKHNPLSPSFISNIQKDANVKVFDSLIGSKLKVENQKIAQTLFSNHVIQGASQIENELENEQFQQSHQQSQGKVKLRVPHSKFIMKVNDEKYLKKPQEIVMDEYNGQEFQGNNSILIKDQVKNRILNRNLRTSQGIRESMNKKPIKLQLNSSLSQDKQQMISNNGYQFYQSEISPNRINPRFRLSQCQSQKHFRVTNENYYRGSNNKTPLSKLQSIREDNHQLQAQKSHLIKISDHSDPEGSMRFQVKSPILFKNLITQKFNQMQSQKSLNTSSKEISPNLLRSQSAQGKQSQIEKILEISKKAKYRDRLSNVEQKFLKKFVNLLNPDDPENQIHREDSQEESDQEPLQQNPFQNKIMEEQFKLQNFRLNLLSNELVNSHQFLKSKLKKQKESRDKQNLFNNFAARMLKNKKLKNQEQSRRIFEKYAYKSNPLSNFIHKQFKGIIRIAEIYKILKCSGRDVLWQRDSIGMTPMHWACKRADDIIIKLLLNYDAPLNAEDMFGRTPINIAQLNEKKSVKKMIRDYQRGEYEKDFQTFNYLELFGKLPNKNKKNTDDQ